MPAQQGLRRHEQPVSSTRRKQLRAGGHEDAVPGPELRPAVLAAKDLQLVAQEHDLDVLRGGRATAAHEQFDYSEEGAVHERSDHPLIVTGAQ
jgi:hypothetical protein